MNLYLTLPSLFLLIFFQGNLSAPRGCNKFIRVILEIINIMSSAFQLILQENNAHRLDLNTLTIYTIYTFQQLECNKLQSKETESDAY